MKHLDVRHLWLQEHLAKGAYSVKKIPRTENPGDVLTHAPSSRELEVFKSMMGLFRMQCSGGAIELVKSTLRARPEADAKLTAMILASLPLMAKTGEVYVTTTRNSEEMTTSHAQLVLLGMLFMLTLVLACVGVCTIVRWLTTLAQERDEGNRCGDWSAGCCGSR